MGYFGVLMQMEVNYFKKYNNVIVLKKNLNLQCFVVQVKYIFIRFCIEIKKNVDIFDGFEFMIFRL